MNFTKYLIIVGLIFTTFVILIFIVYKKINEINSKDIRINKKNEELNFNYPTLEDLLRLEKFSRKNGSGIQFEDLLGIWNFYLVWNQKKQFQDNIFSYLLRLFSAKLELNKSINKDENPTFNIINSIDFGFLSIRFVGLGSIKGSQPLLPFFFEKIEFRLGDRVMLSRQLNIPQDKDRPFFALISVNQEEGWMAARGRGGGLALWQKNNIKNNEHKKDFIRSTN
tara:strand:- start:5047 stop:5718 length:672 start_codon:yes stop_codon:yes gene_type:complete